MIPPAVPNFEAQSPEEWQDPMGSAMESLPLMTTDLNLQDVTAAFEILIHNFAVLKGGVLTCRVLGGDDGIVSMCPGDLLHYVIALQTIACLFVLAASAASYLECSCPCVSLVPLVDFLGDAELLSPRQQLRI